MHTLKAEFYAVAAEISTKNVRPSNSGAGGGAYSRLVLSPQPQLSRRTYCPAFRKSERSSPPEFPSLFQNACGLVLIASEDASFQYGQLLSQCEAFNDEIPALTKIARHDPNVSHDEPNGLFVESGRMRVIGFGAGLSPRQIQQHDVRALLLALEDEVAAVERYVEVANDNFLGLSNCARPVSLACVGELPGRKRRGTLLNL